MTLIKSVIQSFSLSPSNAKQAKIADELFYLLLTLLHIADHTGRVVRCLRRSNAGIVGSNRTQGMDVCVYSVFLLGRRANPPSTESY
jgi:hypothetical protein